LLAAAGHVRRVDRTGTIVPWAGHPSETGQVDGGTARQPSRLCPRSVALGPIDALVIANAANPRIARVERAGTSRTAAGDDQAGVTGAGWPAHRVQRHSPWEVARSSDGCLLMVDSAGPRVHQVDRLGRIATIAGSRPTDHEVIDAPPGRPVRE
jgi:hypothetical protein